MLFVLQSTDSNQENHLLEPILSESTKNTQVKECHASRRLALSTPQTVNSVHWTQSFVLIPDLVGKSVNLWSSIHDEQFVWLSIGVHY